MLSPTSTSRYLAAFDLAVILNLIFEAECSVERSRKP